MARGRTHRGHPDFSADPQRRSPKSNSVIAVHVSAYIPQDHIEDEQNGKNKQSYKDSLSHR